MTPQKILNHLDPSSLLRRGWVLILIAVGSFALSQVQAAVDTPDPGGKPVSNTADGQNALLGITTGIHNSGFGFDALLSNSTANFNTAVGSVALLLDNPTAAGEADENTAVGAGALLSNTTGGSNTAVGTFALFSNVDGGGHTAVGDGALEHNNASGFLSSNTAVGVSALITSISGGANVAVGEGALLSSTASGNTVGALAGAGITTGANIIAIGAGVAGVSTTNGQVDDSCYIGNIFDGLVDAGTALFVFVDQDGKLGTAALPNTGTLPNNQALIGKVQELQATVAQLTQQLKEQAAQIQKVSAQLEVSKPAPQVVANKSRAPK